MNKNELLFSNAHAYRLHADNLRWTLFGAYTIVLGYSYEKGLESYLMWMISAVFLFNYLQFNIGFIIYLPTTQRIVRKTFVKVLI